jgi:PAS domain-containing protein
VAEPGCGRIAGCVSVDGASHDAAGSDRSVTAACRADYPSGCITLLLLLGNSATAPSLDDRCGKRSATKAVMGTARALVEHASDAAFAVDSELHVVAWNQPCCELLGYSPEEVIGRYCYDVLQAVEPCGVPLCTPECEGSYWQRVEPPIGMVGGLQLTSVASS